MSKPQTRGSDRLLAAAERLQYALEQIRKEYIAGAAPSHPRLPTTLETEWSRARNAADLIEKIARRKAPRYGWKPKVTKKTCSACGCRGGSA